MNQKTGLNLWIQQIKSLMVKRFILLKRRYTLGLITLVIPIVAEAVISYVLPNQTDLLNSFEPPPVQYKLDIEKYSPYTMPYSYADNDSSTFIQLFDNYYKQPNRKGIKLEKLENDTIATFVLGKRKENINNLVKDYFTGLSFDIINNKTISANAYFSSMAYHSGASIINEITNLFYAFYNSNDLKKTITTSNAPIAPSRLFTRIDINTILKYLSCIDVPPFSLNNFFNGVIIAVFMSFFVAHVGRERLNGSKHIQLLSGVHFITYWVANLIFDMIICLYTISGLVLALKIIDVIINNPASETYAIATSENLGCYFFLLLFSSISWLAYAYVVSHFFKSEIVGFIVLLLVQAIAVFLDTIWCLLLFIFFDDSVESNKTLQTVFKTLRWVFTFVFPSVTVKRGLFDLRIHSQTVCIDVNNQLFKGMMHFVMLQ